MIAMFFVLGLNQGIIPQSFKDEDFFSDVEKKDYI